MSDWTQHTDRLAARDRFIAELANNGALRARCIKYPIVARKTFADLGGFQLEENLPGPNPAAIPIEAEFRVFDGRSLDREKVVVLVLDRPPQEIPDPDRIWQCTYYPYIHGAGEEEASKAKKEPL